MLQIALSESMLQIADLTATICTTGLWVGITNPQIGTEITETPDETVGGRMLSMGL